MKKVIRVSRAPSHLRVVHRRNQMVVMTRIQEVVVVHLQIFRHL